MALNKVRPKCTRLLNRSAFCYFPTSRSRPDPQGELPALRIGRSLHRIPRKAANAYPCSRPSRSVSSAQKLVSVLKMIRLGFCSRWDDAMKNSNFEFQRMSKSSRLSLLLL
jgi:hypothetical protein